MKNVKYKEIYNRDLYSTLIILFYDLIIFSSGVMVVIDNKIAGVAIMGFGLIGMSDIMPYNRKKIEIEGD